MSKKLTIEEFIQKSKQVHGDKYDYSKVEYNGNKTKVTIICPTHGEFQQIPSGHFRGDGCPTCRYIKVSNALKMTLEEFIKKATQIHSDKYIYSNAIYLGCDKNIEIICKEHGSFWQRPADHLRGHGCKLCRNEKLSDKYTSTTEDFIQKANKIHDNFYNYSKVEYINSNTKVTIICPAHSEFEQTPGSHLQGIGCPKCGLIKTKKALKNSLEEFIERANKTHNHKYDYSKTNYYGNKTKVEIICKEHGSFWQTPNAHSSGQGCPLCKGYRGEIKIREWLQSNNIKFISQKTFKGCKDIGYLRFDFYIPSHNLAIEFNGEQHYRPIMYFGGQKKFEKLKARDNIKKQYCKINNIKLLEIPYSDINNITKILTTHLTCYNIIS